MTEIENKKEELPENLDKDIEERVKGLADELNPLLGKYELGIGALPEYTQDGRTIARPIFMSTRKPDAVKVETDTAGLSE